MTYEELGNYLLENTEVGCFIVVLHQKYNHESDNEYRKCIEYFVHSPEDIIEFDFDFNEGEQCIIVDGIFDLDSAEIDGFKLILRGAVKLHE